MEIRDMGKIQELELEINESRIFKFVKRLFDIVASGIGLIVLSPLLLIVGIAIKMHDQGPVFYSQIRLGKDQEKFKMYKFRSMEVGAEKKKDQLLKQNEVTGAMFKLKDDPRVTKVGKFIRKYSIDELPQLWNVLVGDMSLVGPRPPLEREVKKYSEHDKQRLLVKPGCTGLWQVSGRNNLDFNEMVELDLEYIRKQSFGKDFEILVKTVDTVLRPDGAY